MIACFDGVTGRTRQIHKSRFTIFKNTHSISRKEVKNLTNQRVMLRCTFKKPVLITGVDGVISIKPNID